MKSLRALNSLNTGYCFLSCRAPLSTPSVCWWHCRATPTLTVSLPDREGNKHAELQSVNSVVNHVTFQLTLNDLLVLLVQVKIKPSPWIRQVKPRLCTASAPRPLFPRRRTSPTMSTLGRPRRRLAPPQRWRPGPLQHSAGNGAAAGGVKTATCVRLLTQRRLTTSVHSAGCCFQTHSAFQTTRTSLTQCAQCAGRRSAAS